MEIKKCKQYIAHYMKRMLMDDFTININKQEPPVLYDKNGNRVNVWYMNSPATASFPYEGNDRIFFDKYNYTLDVRFFCDSALLKKRSHTNHKDFAWLRESETIIPGIYDAIIKKPYLLNGYEAVFTYSERILNLFDNAKLFPPAECWYGRNHEGGGELLANRYKLKKKNISMICSDKMLCEMHIVRRNVALKFINSPNVDVYGNVEGGITLPQKSISLDEYRYQIVIENDVSPFYFTEKICDCFAAQVVPIYCGATKIDDFFVAEGIIHVSKDELNNLGDIIKVCTPEDYLARKDAILENYDRVKMYSDKFDLLLQLYGESVLPLT